MDLTGFLRFIHTLGFILWVGVGATAMFMTIRARRSQDPRTIAFAYRTASQLFKTVGVGGMILTLGGGFGLVAAMGYGYFRPFPNHWLFQMQVLGSLAFLVSLFYQIPVSDRLARAAEASAEAGEESAAFSRFRKRNAIVGSVVGVILLVIVILGTFKP